MEIERAVAKQMLFQFFQPQRPYSVSAGCGQIFENDLNRGQPLAVLHPNDSIWHVCRVFRFLGYLVQSNFT